MNVSMYAYKCTYTCMIYIIMKITNGYIYLYVHSIVYMWYVYTCIHYLYKHIYTHNVKEKTQGCLKEKGKTLVYVILILI